MAAARTVIAREPADRALLPPRRFRHDERLVFSVIPAEQESLPMTRKSCTFSADLLTSIPTAAPGSKVLEALKTPIEWERLRAGRPTAVWSGRRRQMTMGVPTANSHGPWPCMPEGR